MEPGTLVNVADPFSCVNVMLVPEELSVGPLSRSKLIVYGAPEGRSVSVNMME